MTIDQNLKNKKPSIALAIPTGRPKVKEVVESFVNNMYSHGHDISNVSVYLSIDLTYKNTKLEDFELPKSLENRINNVTYIDQNERESLANRLIDDADLSIDSAITLFSGNGYSKQRNSALVQAILDKCDYAICFDDDEAPIVPMKTRAKKLEWVNMDFFGPHLDALISGSDITRGPILGYRSPIPSDFVKNVPKNIRIKLGEALSHGSDVISRETFFELMNDIKYLLPIDLSGLNGRPFEVPVGKNGKHIYAGNMGINLNTIAKTDFPIFYTPPGARGEDTIFALNIPNLKVTEVNSFIFHDPFNMYPDIYKGKYPSELMPVPIDSNTIKRFSSALIGWLKYAPILIKMTSDYDANFESRMKKMISTIKDPTDKLYDLFRVKDFKECPITLQRYRDDVHAHHRQYTTVQSEWRTKIVPYLFNGGNQ